MEANKKNTNLYQIYVLIRNLKKWLIPVSTVSLFIILVILALGTIAYQITKQRFIAQKGTEISSIAELKVQQILNFRDRGYRTAQLFYGNQSFIRAVYSYMTNGNLNAGRELNDWLKPLLSDRFFEEIIIIDASTRQKVYSVTSDKASGGFEPGDLDFFKSDSIQFGDFIENSTGPNVQLCIYVPLIAKNELTSEKIAVVKFIINPYHNLYNLMQSMPNRGKTGEVLVVRRDGNDVLYLNELRFRKNTALKFRLPLTSKELPAARAIFGNEMVSEGTDYRGKRVLAIARLIPGTDWSVVVKFDIDEIYAEMRTMGYLIMALIVLLILATGSGLAVIQGRKQMGIYKSRIEDLKTIHRLNRLYELLYNIEQAIVKYQEKEELMNEVCQIVVGQKNYLLCWIGMINKNSGYMEPAAHCGINIEYRENIEFTVSEKVRESSHPLLKAVNSSKHFVSNDIWNDPLLEGWRDKAFSSQFHSMAVFPLTQRHKTIGALFFYADKIGNFSDDEIKLLARLCIDISFGFDKIDLEEKERISRERLIKNEIVLLENENKLKQQNADLKILNERLEKVNGELEKARKNAEESNRLKSTFLANMSHEIRTPMNAVVGFAGLLEKSGMDKVQQEYCQIIIDRSNDLVQIINDILDVSKIDSHTVRLFIENFQFNKFLDDLLVIYQHKLEQSEKNTIHLVCIKPQIQGLLYLATDVLKFRQIFTNLLDNAIKFTETGEIRFGYHSHSDFKLTCFVSDTGIGIHPEEHQKIFDIFTQSDRNSKKSYGGTGLGLAICKGNARLLGGDIYVESEPGKGCGFYFTINYAKGKPEPVKQKKLNARVPANSWKKKEILLIEDDIHSIEYLKYLLAPTGVTLDVARTGKEAEEYFNKIEKIDLVLLDIRLPDSNGVDIMRHLKTLRKELPIIAQTAFALADERSRCLESGFDDYIAKPFSREEFMNLINSYIN